MVGASTAETGGRLEDIERFKSGPINTVLNSFERNHAYCQPHWVRPPSLRFVPPPHHTTARAMFFWKIRPTSCQRSSWEVNFEPRPSQLVRTPKTCLLPSHSKKLDHNLSEVQKKTCWNKSTRKKARLKSMLACLLDQSIFACLLDVHCHWPRSRQYVDVAG